MLSFLTLFSACSHYQYNTISSTHLRLNDKMEFVAENDTMRMEYNFSGAHVRFSLENKLDVPIFIDWKRSALIVDKTSFSYAPARAWLEGEIRDSTQTSTPAIRAISGSIVLPETTEFIPPHAQVVKNPMYLPGRNIGKLADSVTHQVPFPLGSRSKYVQVASFTEENSPLRFRSYITCLVGDPSARPVAYEHHFYVSESMSTDLNTLYFKDRMQDGNRYHTGSSSGAGAVVGLLLVLAFGIAVAASQ
jgi:hypothetical protein